MSSHPLAAVVGRRDRILAAVSVANPPPVWDGPAAGNVAAAVVRVLPPKVQYSAVFKSLLPLVGTSPDRAKLREIAWAMAGDVESLRAGLEVGSATPPPTPTQVTVQVLAARRLPPPRVPQAVPGFKVRYRLKAVSGPTTPHTFDVTWSSRYIRYLAGHPDGLGFRGRARTNRPAKGRPYQHYESLVGMILRVDLSRAPDGKTKVENICCTPTMREYNQALTEMRWRTTFACPFQFTLPCHNCEKGQDACAAACRPQTLVQLPACPACGRAAVSDPYWKAGVCRQCDSDGRRRRALPILEVKT